MDGLRGDAFVVAQEVGLSRLWKEGSSRAGERTAPAEDGDDTWAWADREEGLHGEDNVDPD